MCGRAKITASPEDLREEFGLSELPDRLPLRYNIPPTDPIPILRTRERLELARWGERRAGKKPWYLVRSESSLASWKRCLVVVDGFYEWREDKQPFLFQRPDHKPFALAGVWKDATSEDGEVAAHAFVVTVPSKGEVERIHDRMPLVLRPEDRARWLAGETVAEAEALEIIPVSKRVNSVRNDDPGCVERAELPREVPS